MLAVKPEPEIHWGNLIVHCGVIWGILAGNKHGRDGKVAEAWRAGRVTGYKGKPEIIVTGPKQLKIQ
jgi:hypothetical protein